MVKPHAEGGEGLANFALNHISLECQLHVPKFCILEGIQMGQAKLQSSFLDGLITSFRPGLQP